MFESLALSVLERVLGQYVENLDRNSLKVAVWRGHITLERLKLRREALYSWGLPLDIKAGYVEKIELQIPWNRLGSAPVSITLDGVYLVASPLDDETWDETARREWGWARKQAKLNQLMAQRTVARPAQTAEGEGSESDGEESAAGDAVAQSSRLTLLSRIVNNVQLAFRSIHLRYEDGITSSSPFATGATLAELSIFSANSDGERSFNKDGTGQFKVAKLRGLAVYHKCNCRTMLDPQLPLHRIAQWLRELMLTGAEPAPAAGAPATSDAPALRPVDLSGNYVMAPISACVSVAFRPLGQSQPRLSIQVSLSALSLRLSEQQLRDMLRFSDYAQRLKTQSLGDVGAHFSGDTFVRPVGSTPGSARLAWLIALRRIKAERFRQRGWMLMPGYFEARRRLRLRYVQLYKRSQDESAAPELTDAERRELHHLERDQIAVEDLLHFRSLANLQLDAETAAARRDEPDTPPRVAGRRTWWSWMTGADNAAPDQAPALAEGMAAEMLGQEVHLSVEQRETLAALLSGNSEAESETSKGFSAEAVQHEVIAHLDELSFILVESSEHPLAHQSAEPASAEPAHVQLARLTLSHLSTHLERRAAGYRISGNLAALEVVDCQSPAGQLGGALVRPLASELRIGGAQAAPQWMFKYVERPPDQPVDRQVELSVSSPLEVVCNVRLLLRIQGFFDVLGETEREELAELVRQQARNLGADTVDAVLARRKTTAVRVQLAAPRLVMPYDLADPQTSVLIIDMGAITLTSVVQPAPSDVRPGAATTEEMASIPKREANEDEPDRLYDCYALRVHSMQVLLIPSGAPWRRPDFTAERSCYLVYQLGLELQLYHCILPLGTHAFTDVLAFGSLSEADARALHLHLSLEQLHTILAIVRAVREPMDADAVAAGEVAAATRAPDKGSADKPNGGLRARAQFRVHGVILSLAGLDGSDLIELNASAIELNAQQQSFKRSLTFGLGALRVEDRLRDPGTRCARLLDSDAVELTRRAPRQGRPPESGPLVQLEYLSTTPDVPDELHLRFNHLHLEWNPMTVAALMAFVRLLSPPAMPAPPAAADAPGRERAMANARAQIGAEDYDEEGSGAGRGRGLRVLAELEALSVSLNLEDTDGQQLALFAMRELVTDIFLQPGGGMSASGQLGDLTAQDMYTVPGQPYEMVGLREDEQSLLIFQYDSPSDAERSRLRAAKHCDSSLRLRMSSVRVSYWHPAFMRTVSYLQDGVLGALVSATASTVVQVARSVLSNGAGEASAIALDVEVGSPLLLLPAEANSPDGLRADLGSIAIRNDLEWRAEPAKSDGSEASHALLDCISVTVGQMQLCALLPIADDIHDANRQSSMIEDVSLHVSIERGLGISADRALAVAATGSELVCTCAKTQYDFLMLVAAHNLAGGADTITSHRSHDEKSVSGEEHNPGKPTTFTLDFDLPLVAVSLFGAVPNASQDTQLALVTMHRLRVSSERHDDQSSALLIRLESLQITDAVNEGRRLLNSISMEPEGDGGEKAIIQMQYLQNLGSESDELQLRFNHLHLEWNPVTIAALLSFVRPSPRGASVAVVRDAKESEAHDRMRLTASTLSPTEVVVEEHYTEAVRVVGGRGRGIDVRVQLEALSASLNFEGSGGQQLALFAMRELLAHVSMPPGGGMSASGQLGDLTAQDMYTVPGQPYEMVGLREDEQSLLTFQYNSPSDAERSRLRAAMQCDSSLRLRMSSVRVSYWHPAFMRTVSYLQDGVLGALVSATASTVVQVARSVLSNGAGEASAIALDVEVGSPLLLLPAEANSPDGLRADLGSIAIRNDLEWRAEPAKSDGSEAAHALLDCISVTVGQMQLCALLPIADDIHDANRQSSMIEDVSLHVSIERGLGISADRALAVAATGTELLCSCSKTQYDQIMAVLSQNLGGGADAHLTKPSPEISRLAVQAAHAVEERKAEGFAVNAIELRRMHLSMNSVEVSLFSTAGPIVWVSMGELKAELTQLSNGSAEYDLSCATFVLQDRRPSSGGRRELLWLNPDLKLEAASSKQIQVIYSVGPDSRTLVASLHGTCVNVVPRAFAEFAAFFTSNSSLSTSNQERGSAALRPQHGPSTSGPAQEAGPLPPPAGRKTMVLLSFEATDLMLPRDPDRTDTNGIALRGALCVKYRSEGVKTQVDIEAMQVQLVVRDMESTCGTSILAPTQWSISMTRVSGESPRTQLNVIAAQPIEFFISYSDCKLALHIVTSFRSSFSAPSPVFSGVDPLPTPPAVAVRPMQWPFAMAEHLSFAAQLDSARFVAINDYNGRAIPLASLSTRSLSVVCSGTSEHLVLLCSANTEVHLHNPRVVAWEPLLEPWHFRVMGEVHPLADAPLSEVQIEADEVCNINLSVSMCQLVSTTVLTLIEDAIGLSKPQSSEEMEPFLPFQIVNETGLVVHYGRAAPVTKLVPGETHAFNLWSEADRSSLCNPQGPPSKLLQVALDLWPGVLEVRIDRTGKCALDLEAPGQPDGAPPLVKQLVCEVSLQADRKQLRLVSTSTLHNDSGELLAVRVWHVQQDAESVHPLPPGGVLPLPIRPNRSGYRICLRPMDGEYDWSPHYLLPGDAGAAANMPGATVGMQCIALRQGGSAWHCLVHHKGRQGGVCQVYFHPPIVLRNLLACELRFELRGQHGVDAGWLSAGGDRRAHFSPPMAPVGLRVAVEGYSPSEVALVAAPAADTAAGVLCKEIQLFDGYRNLLAIAVHYESLHGCVHSLSLIAPCWIANRTGLPILLRESGTKHGFCGNEPAVVREIVSENQRRPTVFNDFSADGLYPTDFHGPFSDEHMGRRYGDLQNVWLPTGWVWLDATWQRAVDRDTAANADHQGWQYATNWSTGWQKEAWPMAFVRRRLWSRRRARLSSMTASIMRQMNDAAIRKLSRDELQQCIVSAGLTYQDCDIEELRRRFAEVCAVETCLQASAPITAEAEPCPIMPPVQANRKIELQLPGSSWSHALSLEATGTHGLLELLPVEYHQPVVALRRAYQLGLSVTSAPGQFGRSKMLVVDHRILLVNRLQRSLGYKEHGSKRVGELLPPGARAPFHWQERRLERLLSVCLLDAGARAVDLDRCDWSNALPIDDVGEMNIVCRLSDQRSVIFMSIDVQSDGPTMHVVFTEQPSELAPYRVDNMTSAPLLISQSPCSALQQPRVIQEVLPLARAPFAWEQVVRRPTLDLHIGQAVQRICADDLELTGSIRLSDQKIVRYRMLADGPVKVLQILPVQPPGGGTSSQRVLALPPAAANEDDGRLRTSVQVRLAQVGLSLVAEGCSELIYVSIMSISLGYQASIGRDTMSLRIRQLQIDNQLHHAAFPVLLRSSFSPHERQHASQPPSLELLVQRRVGALRVVLYETVSLRMQSLEIMLDTVLVQTLVLFALSTYADLSRMLAAVAKPLQAHPASHDQPAKVYVRWLNIQPFRLILSCRSVAGGRGFEEVLANAPPAAVGVLNSVSAILSNIDRAPLELKALVLDNTFAPPRMLSANISDYYKEQLLQQVYRLLLSVELLGNPRGLFQRIATGVTDAFYEPLNGMMRGPDEFAQGVLRGGKSLAENTLFGLSDSVGKVSGSLGKSLAELSMDKDYLDRRASSAAHASHEAPRNLGQGFLRSVEDVSGGFLKGVTGVVTKPIQGAQKGGLDGFFKGVAQGAVGLIVKPVVGVADGITSATEGLKTTTTVQHADVARRQRPPRTFGLLGEMRSFSSSDAAIQRALSDAIATGGSRLRHLADGRLFGHVACYGPVGTAMPFVVTTSHVMLASITMPVIRGSGIESHRTPDSERASPLEAAIATNAYLPMSVIWAEPLSNIGAWECLENSHELALHLRGGNVRRARFGSTEERQRAANFVQQALEAASACVRG